ncbi:GerMN domain-containing protein [Halobacillus sp. BBL2006]|uniref:GerMN domain-containing protein n=1 Tax=Halobacillus sp. BBL2006 TaxID=1543706 RepID=UPI000542AF23|nr:GerMN domain-containing protein [Halobacillus sp. BBL2006]KHE73258.1 spore gernimation protein [Halobacillus sp. BBL2006]
MKTLGFKPILLAIFLLLTIGLLSGCLFEGEQSLEKMDDPDKATATDPAADTEEPEPGTEGEQSGEAPEGTEQDTSSETVAREIYLMDESGMVVPQTLQLPASEEVAKQSLEYLVKDGPVTDLLPNGFQAVLPAGTEVLGLNLESDGTMVVDVSEDFKNYEAKDEQKILQAMTYTLTQFDNVKRIKLWINGHEQSVMPVNGTPIVDGVSRSDGINNHVGDQTDVINSQAVTVYFPAQNGEEVYQVPVTTRVKKGDDLYSAVVQALLKGPEFGTSLLQPFNEGAEVVSTKLDSGVLTLSFNESILTGQDKEKQSLSDEALASLVMSLTDLSDVESVSVEVEGVEQVMSESGEPLAEPVTRSDITKAESL